jgi:sugar lactone lactonase YvrE
VVGGCGPGDTWNTIRYPQGLYVTQKQTVFVADSANHRIMEYKPNAETSRKITGKNILDDGVNRLDRPSNMLYDAMSKTLIICDHGNDRVLRRNMKNNTYTKVVGESIACFGLAIDEEGAVYVSDIVRHEVRRYLPGSERGTVVAGGYGQGRRLHQLNRPTYIAVGADQSVYVSDSLNDRVVKWEKGAEKGIVVAGGCGKGKGLNQLYSPSGLIVDRSGTIYVADHCNDRVMRWRAGATRGEVIAGDKYVAGCSAHELNGPQGIAFDRNGNLYVADSHNHRVQCFPIQKD